MNHSSTLQRATAADPQSASELIYATDPGVWDYLFDNQHEHFTAFAQALWQSPENSYSYTESFEFLNADQQRMGLQVAYTGEAEPGLTRAVAPIATSVLPESAVDSLLERAQHIEYLTPAIPSKDYYLHFLSVAAEARGLGLGGKLLTHCIERAQEAGAPRVHLDVYIDNPAVAIYRSFGFEIVVQTTFPNKIGLPPHYRMIKHLT